MASIHGSLDSDHTPVVIDVDDDEERLATLRGGGRAGR
jgi:hypothetical protein